MCAVEEAEVFADMQWVLHRLAAVEGAIAGLKEGVRRKKQVLAGKRNFRRRYPMVSAAH